MKLFQRLIVVKANVHGGVKAFSELTYLLRTISFRMDRSRDRFFQMLMQSS